MPATIDNVFLIAMEYEMKNIFIDYKDRLIQADNPCPYPVFTLKDTNHIIVLTGIGKANAAAATQFAISQFQPNQLINMGLIGCLDNTFEVGQLCKVHTVGFGDVDVRAFNYKFGQIPDTKSNTYTLDAASATEITDTKDSTESEQSLTPITLITLDSFVTDQANIKDAVEAFHPQGVDMELASIAHIAMRNNYLDKLISIKAVVDFVNQKSKQDFYEKEALSFKNLSKVIKLFF